MGNRTGQGRCDPAYADGHHQNADGESAHKRFAYPNYTKLIYKTLFGQSFAELKQSYGIKERESLRDHLTVEQLREVEHLETLVSGLIGVGMSYEQIKAFLAQWYDPQKRIA